MCAEARSRPQSAKSTRTTSPPPAYCKTPKTEKPNLDEFYETDRAYRTEIGNLKKNIMPQDDPIRRSKVRHDEALISRCIWHIIGRRLGIEYPELTTSASETHDNHQLAYISSMVSLFIGNFRGTRYSHSSKAIWASSIRHFILKPLYRMKALANAKPNGNNLLWVKWSEKYGFDVQTCYILELFRSVAEELQMDDPIGSYDEGYNSLSVGWRCPSQWKFLNPICDQILLWSAAFTAADESLTREYRHKFDVACQNYVLWIQQDDWNKPIDLHVGEDTIKALWYLEQGPKAKPPRLMCESAHFIISTGLTAADLAPCEEFKLAKRRPLREEEVQMHKKLKRREARQKQGMRGVLGRLFTKW
jgi:hypothetical protein